MQQIYSILRQCEASLTTGVVVIAIGFILFSMMENMFLFNPAKKPWRSTWLDLQYAFTSMLYPPCIYFVVSAVFGVQALRLKATTETPEISSLVFAGQLLLLVFARDCLIYLRHRFFHLQSVWAFHSIHHSSEEVNWISAVRFHPVENIIEGTGETLLFLGGLAVGVAPAVLSMAAMIIGFYNFFIHSNLNWTFGPLRYLLVSPVFHRWHHSDELAAKDKNFAAMFSCLDLALGTFYMPKNALPLTAGLSVQEKAVHPRTLAGQVLYPFRKR